MANWHMDNYGLYGGDKFLMLNGIYAALDMGSLNDYLWLEGDPDGISGGTVLAHYNGAGNTSRARVAHPGGAQTKMGMARRVWFNNLPPDDSGLANPIEFLNAGSGRICGVTVTSTGRLTMYADGGNSYTTTAPAITANGWWHLEFWSDATNMELRVEGVTVLGPSPHGIVAPAYAQHCSSQYSGWNGQNRSMKIKDTFAMDGTGTRNNGFVGAVVLYQKKTTADVALNWTPSTGADGWSILDNTPPNDAQFISAFNPPPSPYRGSLGPNLPADVTSVKAIMTAVRAMKSDGGDGSLQVGLVSGVSVDLGLDRPITTSMTYWWDISEEDPATNAPWLPSAADAAVLQINRTT